MKPGSPRWTVVDTTPHDHEQLGLDLIREALPDETPYRAWANFDFIADSGQIYEVDCLAVTKKGLFLIELKHYQGTLEGTTSSWYRTVNGRSWEEPNPLLLANRKAKFLKSAMNKMVGRDVRLPHIKALVVLSNQAQDVRLRGNFASGVVGPKGADWVGKTRIPSIQQALVSLEPNADGSRDRQYSPQDLGASVNAFEKLGIRPAVGRRTVRDYVLGGTLEHGDIYQDYLATHRRYDERKRRIRLFPHAKASSEDQRRSASRAAEREFTMFAGQAHPGIERPDDYVDHELGPALLFQYEPEAKRLDRWLQENSDELTMANRLKVVRLVAETLAHAHGDRIFHRSLNPQCVWVYGSATAPAVRIRDWHTGIRAEVRDGETRLPTLVSSLAASISSDGIQPDCYRAPEMRNAVNASPRLGDLFSLGALAYLILSGQEAAASPSDLDEQLLKRDGLSLDGVVDGVPDNLQILVWQATQKDPLDRFSSVQDFLADLDAVEHGLKRETTGFETAVTDLDPLQATVGDHLQERFEVLGRLGTGATSVALLVSDEEANGAERVLKVALEPEHEASLRNEGEALARLQYPQFVRLIGDPLVVGGRQSLLLARAGEETLAERLNKDGTVGDFLERWGSDLLSAVIHLEAEGIAHRDLKPANIGIVEQGKNRERHLVVFDFSLTKAPDTDISAGTAGFIDPFLRSDGRNRWDSHAERYAASVVLYQMATNELPTWGNGGADPVMVDDAEVNLDPARFEPGYAGPLIAFFARAFARNADDRFGSAEEMAAEWAACFTERAQPKKAPSERKQPAPQIIVTRSTPLHELELSQRALSALDRAGLHTVSDLLDVNPVGLNRMRGVGKKTVAEIRTVIAELKERFSTDVETADQPEEQELVSVDRLITDLLACADTDQQHLVLSYHLGLAEDSAMPLVNQAAVAKFAKTNQATVSRVLIDLRAAWLDLDSVSAARTLLVALLERRGAIATLDQLAKDLLARCGSAAPEGEREAKGRAAVRAIFDVESGQGDSRWMMRRKGDLLLAALDPDNVDTASNADPEKLLLYGTELGKRADALAKRDAQLTVAGVVSELRQLTPPAGSVVLADRDLVALASAASEMAVVSSKGELYLRGLPFAEAVARSVGSLLGINELKPEQLISRVRARFPDAADAPEAEEITAILADLGLGYEWEPTTRIWKQVRRSASLTSMSGSSTTYGAPDDIGSFDQRLSAAHNSGRFLVLSTPIRKNRYQLSLAALANADAIPIDVDGLILDRLRAKAADYEVDWQVVLDADAAAAGSDDSSNFRTLVAQIFSEVEAAIAGTEGTVVLYNLGLLARYDKLSMIETLATAVQRQSDSLRSLWVLIPYEGVAAGPVVDGKPIGIVGPSEFAPIPYSWIDAQRTAA